MLSFFQCGCSHSAVTSPSGLLQVVGTVTLPTGGTLVGSLDFTNGESLNHTFFKYYSRSTIVTTTNNNPSLCLSIVVDAEAAGLKGAKELVKESGYEHMIVFTCQVGCAAARHAAELGVCAEYSRVSLQLAIDDAASSTPVCSVWCCQRVLPGGLSLSLPFACTCPTAGARSQQRHQGLDQAGSKHQISARRSALRYRVCAGRGAGAACLPRAAEAVVRQVIAAARGR